MLGSSIRISDAGFSKNDAIADLVSRGHFVVLGTASGWSSSTANGGAIASSALFSAVLTNTTANASAVRYVYTSGLLVGGATAERIDWDKKLWMRFLVWVRDMGGDHTNSVYRVQLKEAVAEGALAEMGLGIRIDRAGDALIAESQGSGYGTTGTGVSLADYQSYWMDIIHYPANKIEWYVNGSLKVTETTLANIPSGSAGDSTAFVMSAINGASAGDGRLYVGNIVIWQEA